MDIARSPRCDGYSLHDKYVMWLIQVAALVAFGQVAIRPRQQLLQNFFRCSQSQSLRRLVTFRYVASNYRVQNTPELAQGRNT